MYGISVFNQLCNVFDKSSIDNYFINKNSRYIKKVKGVFFINDYRIGQRSCLQVNNSCIVVKTNCNFPYFFNVLMLCSDNILVCDFYSDDYFLLKDVCNRNMIYV